MHFFFLRHAYRSPILFIWVKLDSVLMYLCVCNKKKIELPVMGDKSDFCTSSHIKEKEIIKLL